MSLDVWLTATQPVMVFDGNITHNLNTMAMAAGIYEAIWRPEELGIGYAHQLSKYLETGLTALRADPEYFQTMNPENGWGSYETLVGFVEKYLDACREYPNAEIGVSR